VWTPVNSEYRFTFLEGGIYFNNSLFMMTGEMLKYLCAIFNSKLFIFYLNILLAGENYTYGSGSVFNSLPVCKLADKTMLKKAESLVNVALQTDNKTAVLKQIDDLIYQIYGLTEEEILLIEPDRLINFKFNSKPSVREIVEKIAKAKPSLMDDDREFCYIFDKIALNNGFTEDDLPSYWTIGRSIFNYKKENSLAADTEGKSTSALTIEPNIPANILTKFQFDAPKPSIKKILQAIGKYDPVYFDNDRKLVELFDAIAINNGYDKAKLPKYWNIIRSMFDCKKELKNEKPIADSSSAVQKL
jgi:hypothetical protein